MSLFNELKRRNVFRVAAAYVVVGWLFFEVAKTLLETFGAPDWIGQSIVILLSLGFVPVVVFSWVYELTPEGIKRETEVHRDESITAQTGRKLELVTIAAVIVGVGVLVVSRYVLPPETHPGGNAAAVDSGSAAETEITITADDASVAVLPFENMSGSQDNEYFSDGLTETLLHMLAQIPELKVAARTSSFAYKGQHQDIRRIADALDVAHVLEGSVQRAGDRVRVTAQLIRAADGYHIWSDQFDRSLTDIFAIQDEIANEVGTALSASLLGADEDVEIISIGTENIAAYEMYLEALTHKAVGSYGSLTEAIDLLKGALARDPDFHDAKHLLAQVYMQANNTGLKGLDSIKEASALIAQVVAARPNDAASRASQVIIDAVLESQTGNAEAFPQALPVLAEYVELAPNEADLRLVLANSLSFFGQPDAAARHFDELLKRDPQNPAVHYGIGDSLLRVQKFEKARAAFERSLELNPNQPNAYANLGDAAAGLGDFVGFIDGYFRASEVDPRDHELVALIAENLFNLGLVENGDEFLNRARAISPSSPATRRVELVRTYLMGDADTSLELSKKMLDDQVENRQGAFFLAAWTYAQLKLRNGEAQAAYDYLATVMPNVHEPELPAPLQTVQGRDAVFGIWAAVLPQDELEAKLDAVIERSERVGFRPADTPDVRVRVLALKGQIDEAVEFGLEHLFTKPYSWYNYFRWDFKEAAFAELAEDPRVQAELIRLEQEEAQAREDVRRYFANRN